jgi:deoxyribodipyrimidine photo-lyase
MVPTASTRCRVIVDREPNPAGRLVLYWMTACRRVGWNFAMDRAVAWAVQLKQPLLVVEVLGCGGRWQSDRHHAFVLQGMADNARRLQGKPVAYRPLVERKAGEAEAVLAALAAHASVVVTDDFPLPVAGDPAASSPAFHTAWAASGSRIERIDGNGLLPVRAADRAYPTAFAFRRFLQKTLPDWLLEAPRADPLSRAKLPALGRLPPDMARCWPTASAGLLSASPDALRALPIDHSVEPVEAPGGTTAARRALDRFLKHRLPRYTDERNEPDSDTASGLSPYLHHGHVSPFEIFDALGRREGWSPDKLAEKADGRREGWWGMSAAAESFLDELVTWRELGFNFCAFRDDYDRYESLPDWARKTLADHAGDPRGHTYSLQQFEAAETHDPLWNAAQRQLVREGVIHNYLRMLWGKKILQWTSSPEEALDVMIELNNKHAIDGCDPNSYSGIFWVLGRYDRPWGPERPIFGKVRYMSSRNTARKVQVDDYIQRYSEAGPGQRRGRDG